MNRTEHSKKYPLEALSKRVRALQRQGKKVVFTNGCFDLLHAGHVRYLIAARQLGDCLIVGVNSDASVRRLKGEARPIVPQKERMEVLAALEPIDHLVLFSGATPDRVIRALRPDILVKGGDWSLDKIVGRDTVERAGGRVVRINLVAGRSTTHLIDRILARYRK